MGDITFDEIRQMGFSAILSILTAGAGHAKIYSGLGVVDELKGVYHAKDVVYHYNELHSIQPEGF